MVPVPKYNKPYRDPKGQKLKPTPKAKIDASTAARIIGRNAVDSLLKCEVTPSDLLKFAERLDIPKYGPGKLSKLDSDSIVRIAGMIIMLGPNEAAGLVAKKLIKMRH